MATEDIATEIAQLDGLDLEAIRRRWRMQFGRSAPKHLSKRLLYRLLAYRLQSEHYGDLKTETIALLETLAKGTADDVPSTRQMASGKLRPGTVLMREHDGVRHHVMVVGEGFSWNGTTFPSLSQVAKAITGTAWNGPRFFGLRDRKRAVHV